MLSDVENDGFRDRAAAGTELATLRAYRVALADRLEHSGSWWPWDVGIGLWLFLLFGLQSLHGTWVSVAVLVLAVGGAWGVHVGFRRATGTWISAWRPGRTRRGAWCWVAWVLAVSATALVAEYELGLHGAMAVAGVVLGVTVAAFNRWWMRVYLAGLRSGL